MTDTDVTIITFAVGVLCVIVVFAAIWFGIGTMDDDEIDNHTREQFDGEKHEGSHRRQYERTWPSILARLRHWLRSSRLLHDPGQHR